MNIRLLIPYGLVIVAGLAIGAGVARATTSSSGPTTATSSASAESGAFPGAGGQTGPRAGASPRAGANPRAAASPRAGASPQAVAASRPGRPAATGPIDSVADGQIVVREASGPVTVKVGPNTPISKTVDGDRSDLQPGTRVAVATDAGDQTTATTITLAGPATGGGQAGAGPAGGGQAAGAGRAGRPNGGAPAGPANQAGNGAFVGGTVAGLDGDQLTITTQNGTSRTVTIGPETKIRKTAEGSPADLVTGAQVVVTGEAGADGAIDATAVRLLPAGSTNGG